MIRNPYWWLGIGLLCPGLGFFAARGLIEFGPSAPFTTALICLLMAVGALLVLMEPYRD